MAICNNKKCSLGECDQPETCTAYVPVITNADRIRSMSDEELAAFLCNLRSEEAYGNACANCVAESFCHIGHTGMIDWLRLPVEDTECT